MPPLAPPRNGTAPAPAPSRAPVSTVLVRLPPVDMAAFAGPLDLLLHLVRAGRMDIFDLPIATLCRQYLDYLAAMDAMDLNVAGEFLVMAATLVEIKSRLLLPAPPKDEADETGEGSEDEDPRAELVRRLLEYNKYQSIADTLKDAEGERRAVFFRSPGDWGNAYATPPRFGELSAESLLRALERMLAAVGAGERSVTSVRRQKITLRMKMREVQGQAERAGADGLLLDTLLPDAPVAALLEVVLLFLALLELMKMGVLQVLQDNFCGEIRLFFIAPDDRAALVSDATHEADV